MTTGLSDPLDLPPPWTAVYTVAADQSSRAYHLDVGHLYRLIDTDGRLRSLSFPTIGLAGTLIARPALALPEPSPHIRSMPWRRDL